ncbi:MAG TPA: hypothetical protein VLM39_12055 [Ignavibacteriaceae bacterium]|nr:hypothetical protein [Ignavibacteriaceae bacterium]
MKKILSTLAIIIFSSVCIFAQEETLIGNGEVSNGGFGGPVVKFTQIKGEPAVLVGGRGGWIINHSFVIGGGGYGLANDIEADIPIYGMYSQPFINFGYGGFEMEYIINSDKIIHFSVATLIGGGGVSYRNDLWNDHEDWDSPHDEFFVLEPSANIELNIISFFRINAGVSYRFISGTNLDDLKNSDLAGPAASLTLKFGSF